jgi:hypothetical protein
MTVMGGDLPLISGDKAYQTTELRLLVRRNGGRIRVGLMYTAVLVGRQ